MPSPLSPDFTHQFLLAMPGMADPNFAGAVVYVAEHNARGALGLVINRTTEITLGTLFERIQLPLAPEPLGASPVFLGGPVQTDRGFVLHQPLGHWNATVAVADGVGLTSSRDILEAVSRGEGPGELLVALGYAGWSAGQLEDEMARNAWLSLPADAELIFRTPVEQRLVRAFALLGIDPAFLSMSAGHA
jgi:putative transcriptional regulator